MKDSLQNENWNYSFNALAIVSLLCTGLTLYNAIEILLLIFTTFKKWSGLYFWAFLVTCAASCIYAIGFALQYFVEEKRFAGDILNNIGWIVTVTGHSIVLYSRLHLVLQNQRILRFVLWMIIIDAFVFYIPTTTTHYVSLHGTPAQTLAAGIIEKIQMTGFCIQEFILSGLYIHEVLKSLKIISSSRTRRTMWQLFSINIVIILLDIALLIMEYLNLRTIEVAFKGFTYSMKLKMEFAVLSKLISMVRHGGRIYYDDGENMFAYDNASQRSPNQNERVCTRSTGWTKHVPSPSSLKARVDSLAVPGSTRKNSRSPQSDCIGHFELERASKADSTGESPSMV